MVHPVLAATLLLAAPLLLQAQEAERRSPGQLIAALPAPEAERVQLLLSSAREHELEVPLSLFAHELLAKSVAPEDVVAGVERRLDEFMRSADALRAARSEEIFTDEIVAGAELVRRGANGEDIAALASGAPAERSLVVPLLVTAELMDRGLPADAALARVHDRILARATDAELRIEPERVRGQQVRAVPPGLAISAGTRGANQRIPARPPRARGRPNG